MAMTLLTLLLQNYEVRSPLTSHVYWLILSLGWSDLDAVTQVSPHNEEDCEKFLAGYAS